MSTWDASRIKAGCVPTEEEQRSQISRHRSLGFLATFCMTLGAFVLFALFVLVVTWPFVGAVELTDCRAKLAAVEQKNGGK